jgi:two-component system sensor histidine kinase QseC
MNCARRSPAKTQAQVALAAGDAATREAALRQILVSVDRSARLVRQLLALAQLAAAPSAHGDGQVEAGALLRDVAHAAPRPVNIAVEIDPALDGLVLRGDRETLHLVLRNLHENAVEHMPEGGCITWKHLPDRTGLMVEDQGPGIPEDELPLVTQRFYRGRHKSPSGTGLGLTIAEAAAARVRARLTLANRTARKGVRASVEWLPCL